MTLDYVAGSYSLADALGRRCVADRKGELVKVLSFGAQEVRRDLENHKSR